MEVVVVKYIVFYMYTVTEMQNFCDEAIDLKKKKCSLAVFTLLPAFS